MCTKHWILGCNERLCRLVGIWGRKGYPVGIDFMSEIISSQRAGMDCLGRESDRVEECLFAWEITIWVEKMCEELDISRLHIFASSGFIEMLRESWSPKIALRIVEHHASLSNLSTYELLTYLIRDGLIQ